MQRCSIHMDAGKDVVQSRRCFCTSGSFALRYAIHIKARSHRVKANAKAKKVKEQSEEIKEKKFKHQGKFSLSRLLSLGVNSPLHVEIQMM